MRRTAPILVVSSLAAAALGSPRESVQFSGVDSNGGEGSAANQVRTPVFAGGYAAGKIRVTGTLTKVHAETFASEARIRATPPAGGQGFVLQPFTADDFVGSISVTDWVYTLPQATPADGVWTFRFFESYNDGGDAEVDAVWDSITITLDDDAPPPPPDHTAAIELGNIGPGSHLVRVDDLAASRAYQWYTFTLTTPIDSAHQTFLDIDDNGTVHGPELTDTEIALFDGAGNLVAQDDDQGVGLWSLLSHGHDTRGGEYDGQDPDLAAGRYYLLVAPYNAVFAGGWSVSTTSPSQTMRTRLHMTCGVDSFPGVQAPSAVDLGVLAPPGAAPPVLALGFDDVVWYRFELAQGVDVLNGLFLDIDTEGSALLPENDTELALYSAAGARVTLDDDDGSEFLSQFSFGSGSTTGVVGDGLPYNGRDGALAAGVYYLAVSGHPAEHATTEWGVSSASGFTGLVSLRIFTNTNAPPVCPADFNDDGFLDFFDADAFVACFEGTECPPGKDADYNLDGFVDFFDADAFMSDFEAGC